MDLFFYKREFSVFKHQLIESVEVICQNINHNKNTALTDGKPGRSWYELCLKCRPEVSKRISENVHIKGTVPQEVSKNRVFFA